MRKGINVFYEARSVFGSVNESEKLVNFSNTSNPCVFLSHRSSDKAAVKAIGEYIKDAGINIYMDIDDLLLQAAVASNNHEAITLSIERGINSSTDLIAFVSEKTFDSYWVPYEIGYGKNAEKFLSCLRLNDTPTVPSYLNISFVRNIDGFGDLRSYLKEVKYRSNCSQRFSGARSYVQLLTEEAESNEALSNPSNYRILRKYLDE